MWTFIHYEEQVQVMTILSTLQVIKRFVKRISFALPTRQTPRHSLDIMTFIIDFF